MTDKQYKRVMRAFFALLFAMVILTGIIIYTVQKRTSPQVNNYIETRGTAQDGKPFTYADFTPEQLSQLKVKGDNGTNSISTSTVAIQPVYTNIPIPGKDGEKGDKGTPAPLQIIIIDPSTCQLRTKYEGDDLWQTLAQLPKPCEVQ